VYQNLLFRIYMKLNMFRATHRPSSGAWNYTSSLWCFAYVEGCWTWQRPANARPTTFHYAKPEAASGFRLLIMGGVSPETCWALYKYGIINFDTLSHPVGFFCMKSWRMSSALLHHFITSLGTMTVVRFGKQSSEVFFCTFCSFRRNRKFA